MLCGREFEELRHHQVHHLHRSFFFYFYTLEKYLYKIFLSSRSKRFVQVHLNREIFDKHFDTSTENICANYFKWPNPDTPYHHSGQSRAGLTHFGLTISPKLPNGKSQAQKKTFSQRVLGPVMPSVCIHLTSICPFGETLFSTTLCLQCLMIHCNSPERCLRTSGR